MNERNQYRGESMLTTLLIIIYIAFISLGLPDAILGSAWPMIYQDFKSTCTS